MANTAKFASAIGGGSFWTPYVAPADNPKNSSAKKSILQDEWKDSDNSRVKSQYKAKYPWELVPEDGSKNFRIPDNYGEPIPILTDVGKFLSGVQNGVEELFGSDTTPQTGVSAKPVVYSDWSPVSRLFGMSQDTAFSEHMANTAHQREVADLKAAGLNPVLGISGSGASAVSGNSAIGSSSALKADDNKFLDIIGATSALVTSLVTKNPMYGYMVANIFKSFD